MKKNAAAIIAIIVSGIACVLTAICIFQVTSLKDKINSMHYIIDVNMDNITSSVNRFEGVVDYKFQELASPNPLAYSHYGYGHIDTDNMTVKVFCSIIPKEFSQSDTTAVLILNNKELPLTLNNGAFTTTLDIPLFDTSEITAVQFTDAGVAWSETLSWSLTPHESLLLDVNAWSESEPRYYGHEGFWALNVEIEGTDANMIQSVEVIEVLDGNEINRMPIELNEEEDNKENLVNYQYKIYDDQGLDDMGIFAEISNRAEFYIEVVDEYEFHYRIIIDNMECYDDNVVAGVYDLAGNLLYKIDDEIG